MENKCALCNLEEKTKWYFDNEKWNIFDCISCAGIVVSYKEHIMKVPLKELIFILNKVKELFGENILIRTKQRIIKDHFHFHVYKI